MVSLLGLLLLSILFFVDRDNSLSATYNQVFKHHEFWRAFTSPLLHADIEHLGSNALFFAGLAYLLNGYFGFWAFPVLSFLAGGMINLIVLPLYPPHDVVLGASGIVYFMAAFWLTLYCAIERGRSKARRFTNAAAFALVLLLPDVLRENVSYLSHAVGFGLGVLLGAFYFLIKRSTLRSYEVWRAIEPDELEALNCLDNPPLSA